MLVKSLAAGVAALAAFGAVTTGATAPAAAAPQVRLTVIGAPLAPAADVPSPAELTGLLNGLADPAVPFADKVGLLEGGIGPSEAAMADHKLHKAERKGQLPLSFSVANIAPAGPGAASADVTVSGPKLPATTQNIAFVDQGGWKLSMASATQLLQAASGK